ncbi:hypothetical protein [Dyadobacter aurulentus]|uniref:hypothetical protein n=1 Tax=Dyadobacter sp. UC 10 TaxID=2605428 RepID=UPI0011F2C87A|nr:hypothetical protein [Dyadobacter sp. UC 10]KAA0991554.1 hypothetical protein FXO21_15950 [Dyadobacter sp. UC 10]
MLTRTVKISNVTNLSDARYCAGMGVEMLGFSIDEDSPNYISPKKFEDICSWLAGVTLVAETADSSAESILAKLQNYPVHAVQVEQPALLGYLKSELTLPLILRISVDLYEADEIQSLLDRYGDAASNFLLESDQNAELSPNWLETLSNLATEHPLLIGFGLNSDLALHNLPENVGIALRGSEEIRPGYKDFGSMMDILEALEEQ